MSSSSFSSESSAGSAPSSTTIPSSALAEAARMRRHRRDAISRQAESEWDAPLPPPPTQSPFSTGWTWTGSDHPVPPTTTTIPVPPPGDQLICPLAALPTTPPSSFSFAFPHVDASPPDQADDGNGELQATLARFAFPSTTRKHRRSGESIVLHPTPPPPSSTRGGATRGCGTGPVKRAQCTHCEHARTSV